MSADSDRYRGKISLSGGSLKTSWDRDRPPPAKPGVYTISVAQPFQRLRGHATTLYIGRSSNIGNRTSQIEDFSHHVSGRISGVLEQGAHWWPGESTRQLDIAAECHDDPELEEVRLLSDFELKHGELPPLNRAAPGYLPFVLIRRVADALGRHLQTLRGFGPGSLRVGAPWEDWDDGIIYVDIRYRRVLRAQVAWKWSHHLGGAPQPGWWPRELACEPDALHLFMVEGWSPPNLPASRPSKAWRRTETADDSKWLLHRTPIPLTWERIDRVTEHQVAVWSLHSLGEGARSLLAHTTITAALAEAWEHLRGRLAPLNRVES